MGIVELKHSLWQLLPHGWVRSSDPSLPHHQSSAAQRHTGGEQLERQKTVALFQMFGSTF